MKLTFENLGPLEFGEIELADLTVICGENNTGKTYVTYLIYCLLTSWKHLIDINLKTEFNELKLHGVIKIDLQKKIADSWSNICEDTVAKFIKQFPEMLASKSELFARLSIKVDIPLGTSWKQREFKSELRSTNGNLLVTMTKLVNLQLSLLHQSKEVISPSITSLEILSKRICLILLEETFQLFLSQVLNEQVVFKNS
jgi:hypothetical protein